MKNTGDKLKLTEFILDELNIKHFRGAIIFIFMKKLTHKDLSNIAISILKNK
jgi:hypothetical protein